jgi:hypothetical protein
LYSSETPTKPVAIVCPDGVEPTLAETCWD